MINNWPTEVINLDKTVPLEGEGSCWIQWKGTNVCMDVRCRCGAEGHIDNSFTYFYKCQSCGQLFAVGSVVRLYAMTPEAEQKADRNCIVTDPENAEDA